MNDITNPLGLKTLPSVSSEGLSPVGKRLSLRRYISNLWDRRYYILADSRAKMAGSSRGNILGFGWLILNPVLTVIAYWFIFGFILQTSRGVENFLGFLIVGIFFFQYTARSMNSGAGAVRSGSNMIKAFQFPRAALPISIVVRNLLDFIPSVLVMSVILIVIPPLENINWHVLLILPVVLLQTIFNIGLSCFVARIGFKLPDLSNVMSVISRFWLYGSGVIFSIDEMLANSPELLTVMRINPMYSFLELARDALLYGTASPGWMWASAAAWALGMLVVGFLVFWKGEESYGRP